MPAPGTTFIGDDQSQINRIEPEQLAVLDRPVFFCAFTADKGPSEYVGDVDADTFDAYYGDNIDFKRHGQALLTAAQVVNAGGKLFAKRIVGEHTKLANIGIIAKVSKRNVQKTDENGKAIFHNDVTGEETTNPAGGTAVMIQTADITYQLRSVDMETNNPDNIKQALIDDTYRHTDLGNEGVYPLFLITDIGPGISNKRFRMYINDTSKRPVPYASYYFKVLEGTTDSTLTEKESYIVSANPNVKDGNKNMSVRTVLDGISKQVHTRVFEDEWDEFIENVAYIAGLDSSEVQLYDILGLGDTTSTSTNITSNNSTVVDGMRHATDLYGKKVDNITINQDSVNLADVRGIGLLNGSYGTFGVNPMKDLKYYYAQMLTAFNGTYDDIYDVDNNRIDVIFDCNFTSDIKRAIENLVGFRQDCYFFEDLGIDNVPTFNGVKATVAKLPDSARTKFTGIYSNYWDIYNPYSGKQITVTSTYNLAIKFVRHFMNGVSRPFCGQAYGITFNDEVIDGTINFTPKITPKENQKQFFDDKRVNYATYYDGILTMDSEYTAQEAYTQLSWANNVLMVQGVIRDIRKRCPINRYKFTDGDDLVQYKADVEAVIARHSGKFKSITIEYVQDENYDLNKIFYAVISVVFRNFIQSEIFKITTLRG